MLTEYQTAGVLNPFGYEERQAGKEWCHSPLGVFPVIHKSSIFNVADMLETRCLLLDWKSILSLQVHWRHHVSISHLFTWWMGGDGLLSDKILQPGSLHYVAAARPLKITALQHTTISLFSYAGDAVSKLPCTVFPLPLKCELSCGISITCNGAVLSLCRGRFYFSNVKCFLKPWLGKRASWPWRFISM